MKDSKRLVLVSTAICVLLALPVRAHDLWVVPGRFHLTPGEKVRVFLNSGDEFPMSVSLLGEHRVRSFSLLSASGRKSLGGFAVEGKSLTFELTAPGAGTVVLAVGTRPRLIRLKADEFNEYLKEDGLPRVLELRKELGEMDEPAVERYAKWAKAILRVGDRGDDVWSKPTGLKLEIIPEEDPFELQPGDDLSVLILFEGEPLSGLVVSGGRAGGPRNEVNGVTGSDGRAQLRISEPGRWVVRTIHMVRQDDDPEVQWESFWATLTFEVRR